jgi:serine/threonine-protein kinase RsbW
MSPIILTLEIPGHLDYLSVAVDFIKGCALKFGIKDKALIKTHLAAEEALVNILENSIGNNPEEPCTIICRGLPTKMEIAIRDKGIPFPFHDMPEFNPNAPDDPNQLQGLGLFLLKQSVDEIHMNNLGAGGNETLLVHYFTDKRIDGMTAPGTEEIHPRQLPDAGVETWSVRAFRPEDAVEVARCAYAAYGYSYDAVIYYPDLFSELIRTGSIISRVAVDQDNRLMAHMAIKCDHSDSNTGEIGMAFVNPAYRRLGLFGTLTREMIRLAEEQGMHGVHVNAVTTHTISQKMAASQGFRVCGLMLGTTHADVNFKGLSGTTGYRDSDLLIFLPLAAPPRQIHPPERHKGIIRDIFTETRVPVSSGTGTLPQEREISSTVRLSVSKTDTYNTATVYCHSSDADAAGEIRTILRKLCLERVDVIYLYINLESPGCPSVTEVCETRGFFFSGVMPYGIGGHHALILQYLNNLEMDFSHIHLHDPFAHTLAGYIQASQKAG